MSCKRSAVETLATVKQYLQDHESEPDTMCVNDVLQKCNVSSDKYYKIHLKHQLSVYVVLPLKHA